MKKFFSFIQFVFKSSWIFKNKTGKLWFPIEALIMSELAADGDGTHLGLKRHLDHHPAIKTIGMTNSIENAWSIIRKGKTNTIFISPFIAGVLWEGIIEFISDVRATFPDIAFVLYCNHYSRDKMFEIKPKFADYYFIEEVFGSANDAEDYLPRKKEVNEELIKCDRIWHRTRKNYEIGISYAGEDIKIAKDIFLGLKELKENRVFFDKEKAHDYLGKDLSNSLSEVYKEKCRYAVVIISNFYLQKAWTQHEMKAISERTDVQEGYYIPVTVDTTVIPGLVSGNTLYLDISKGISQIVEDINRRLWVDGTQQKEYLEISLF